MEQSVDIGRPFAFIWEDADWLKKCLLAALILLIPIAGFFILFGYQRRIALATAAGKDVPLPEWDLIAEDLMEGLKIFAIRAAYVLPGAIILVAIWISVMIFSAAGGSDVDSVLPVMMMGGMCLGMPLLLAGVLLGSVATIRFIHDGSLAGAFHPAELFAFARENLVNLLLALVAGILLGIAAQLVGLVMCFVGIFFTRALAMIANGQVMGQVIRAHRARHLPDSTAAAVFT